MQRNAQRAVPAWFSSVKPDHDDPYLEAASEANFTYLAECLKALTGVSAFANSGTMRDAFTIWALAHGMADRISSQRMQSLVPQTPDEARAERAEILRVVIAGIAARARG